MHVIHLRGPWECLSAAIGDGTADDAGAAIVAANTAPRLQLPLTISPEKLPLQNGQLVLSRKFGRPTGIQPGDTIKLVICSLPLAMLVQLGELNLGTWQPSRQPTAERLDLELEVTNLLRERNQLVLTIAVGAAKEATAISTKPNSAPLAPWPEVCLKIYPTGA